MPRAMALAVATMLVATVLPILVACAEGGAEGADGRAGGLGNAKWDRWALGSFSDAGEVLGGNSLGAWCCAAGVASSLGLLNAFMYASPLHAS